MIDSTERLTAHVAPGPRLEQRTLVIGGELRQLRLLHRDDRWLASIDTEHGPTLGADHSPYLAAARALEPLGIGLAEAMAMLGPIASRR